MPEIWRLGQLVEGAKEFGDNPVGRLEDFFSQQVKPNVIDIADSIFGELKWVEDAISPN